MPAPQTLTRLLLLETVIMAASVGAAWGVFLLLQWSMMLPETRSPVLAVIVMAVVMTRLATSRWFNRLLTRASSKDDR